MRCYCWWILLPIVAAVEYHRELLEPFQPLACNAGGCSRSSTWLAERYDPSKGLIVIPCGVCITMNVDSSETLVLPYGLDIQGTLKFTNRYRNAPLRIETPFVRVRGKLIIRANRGAVKDTPHITFHLTDSTKSPPPDCEPTSCDAGEKAIVVAGGQLDIRAYRNRCKTWVKLHDIATSKRLPTVAAKSFSAECSAEFREDFQGQASEWSANKDFRITEDGTLYVGKRLQEKYGPLMDLARLRRCFVAGQTYLLWAKIRLHSSSSGKTACAARRQSCLRMQAIARFQSGTVGNRKGGELTSDQWEYNKWQTLMASFSFSEKELAEDSLISHILLINGAESGVDIEIDDVRLELAPTYDKPEDICTGNLVINGDTNGADHIYPMEIFGLARLSVQPGLFRVDRRQSNLDSIAYFATHCIVPGGRYKVSARIRIRSANSQVKSVMTFRLGLPDGSLFKRDIATCPPSRDTWVVCESEFLVGDDFQRYDTARFAFETEEGRTDPFEVTDWLVEFQEVVEPSIFVKENGVKGCWGKGAEVLITSHTNSFESAQTRRLAANPVATDDGYVRLKLDKWIRPPVTEKDGDGFAVEVALLSRHVVFESAEDLKESHLGGHLIVMNTPKVRQRLQGVEFKNFGRQGELGRYPIHFHMSENVKGSVVKQNSIRNSNQRCVVIHGTHNVTVADNVAFETKGHCYMLEDGGELDNTFSRNLGASTRASEFLVRRFETDGSNPSTFWISNPQNTFVENVAAGSESSGFWFELNLEVRSPTLHLTTSKGMVPRHLPLKRFQDNVAHSNVRHGLRTYPNGFEPPTQAVFHNTRSYKNMLAGIFLHNTENILVNEGVYADNSIQIDLDRADSVDIHNVTLVGSTAKFKHIVGVEEGVFGSFDETIGIQLHSFRLDDRQYGSEIRGVHFLNFDDTLASRSALIDVDERKLSGVFDYWTTIENVRVDGQKREADFDFSKARDNGIVDIFITDKDGSLNYKTPGRNGPSAIISSSYEMTAFVDTAACFNSSTRGYFYCPDTCLRTFIFQTSPSEPRDVVLRVSSSKGVTVDHKGKFHFEYYEDEYSKPDMFLNTWIKKHRFYSATLPMGDFSAEFIDLANGKRVWPDFVQTVPQEPQCSPSLPIQDLKLLIPPPLQQECMELIRNGDLESSDNNAPYWLHNEAGIKLLSKQGIESTNTIIDTETRNRDAYFGQFVDTRCLVEGSQFTITAWVKLVLPGTMANVACDKGGLKGCPSLKISFRLPGDDLRFEQGLNLAIFFVRPFNAGGWNMLQSTLTIDSRLASAEYFALNIRRGAAGLNMMVDNVSMIPVPDSCEELIFNGDFSSESSLFWEKQGSDSSDIDIIHDGENPALFFSRSSTSDFVVQYIKTGCIKEKDRFKATARIRLLDSFGKQFDCDRSGKSRRESCPKMRIQSTMNIRQDSQESNFHFGGRIADVDYDTNHDGWFVISGIFTGTLHDQKSDRSTLMIGGPLMSSIDIVIDDVSIMPLEKNCADLLVNGDAEEGDTALFWRMAFPNELSSVKVIKDGGSNAFTVVDRTNSGDGMIQVVDARCFDQNSSWRVSARMKLRSRSSNSFVKCEVASTNPMSQCPLARIHGIKDGTKSFDAEFYVSTASWSGTSSWNEYEVLVTIPENLASYDQVWLGIRSYNIDWDLIVDDLSMTRL